MVYKNYIMKEKQTISLITWNHSKLYGTSRRISIATESGCIISWFSQKEVCFGLLSFSAVVVNVVVVFQARVSLWGPGFNSQRSICLCFPSAGIKGRHHQRPAWAPILTPKFEFYRVSNQYWLEYNCDLQFMLWLIFYKWRNCSSGMLTCLIQYFKDATS